jgi:hypothetical protein
LLCFLAVDAYASYPRVQGAVLSPGKGVIATNKNGTVKIFYISPTSRKYQWDGKARIIKLTARSRSFDGRLGLYDPADSWGLNPFEVRAVVQEAVRNFESLREIYAFLRQSSNYMDWVYTSDGLVVGFGRTPARKQINIDLWQLLLKGAKPQNLRGANLEAIRLVVERNAHSNE